VPTPQKQTMGHTEQGTETEQDGIVVWDRKGVVVVWPDGHRSRVPWAALRAACQCAECRAQRESAARLNDLPAV
jgi:DUF971 family protein